MLLVELLCDVLKKNIIMHYQIPIQHRVTLQFVEKMAFVCIAMFTHWGTYVGLLLVKE